MFFKIMNGEIKEIRTIFRYLRYLGPSVLDLVSKESSHVAMENMFAALHHG